MAVGLTLCSDLGLVSHPSRERYPESRVSVRMPALHHGRRGGGPHGTPSLLLVSVPVPPLLYVYSLALLSSSFSL